MCAEYTEMIKVKRESYWKALHREFRHEEQSLCEAPSQESHFGESDNV